VQVAIVSHGVGSPGAAVCFEELIRGGVKTLIRVGTAGSYTAELPPGSLVVSTAAAREEGLTRQLVPSGFPAVADHEVVAALWGAAAAQTASAGAGASAIAVAGESTGAGAGTIRKGMTLTLDAFFAGVEELPHKKYKQAGILAVEMEIAALYVVASLRGARAGAIVALDGFADADLAAEYNPHTDVVSEAVEREIEIALEAIVRLATAAAG
jgi:uridine phosphorylase